MRELKEAFDFLNIPFINLLAMKEEFGGIQGLINEIEKRLGA